MAEARRGAVPQPVPAGAVQRGWAEVAGAPELACAPAWAEACRAWWEDAEDPRLRDAAAAGLLLGGGDLAAWLAQRLDAATLVRAHGHVTAQRAGHERDVGHRHLEGLGLRTTPVAASHRGGGRTTFGDAADVPARIAALAAELDALPAHPWLRAAWIIHAVGAIHPFRDGNGGTSRFLASLELARSWLPPVQLSIAQRNGPYIDALMHANRVGDLVPLAGVLHDAVQAGLASALLEARSDAPGVPWPRDDARGSTMSARGTRVPVGAWDAVARARAARWTSTAERAWRVALGEPLAGAVVARAAVAPAIARLARRGHRLPSPAPRCATWALAAPLPLQLDLAIVALRGGPGPWLLAVIDAGIDDDGALGAAGRDAAVGASFVAPAGERDEIADARFARWAAQRIAQCVQGLAAWM